MGLKFNEKRYHIDENGIATPIDETLTKREQFAMAALQGMLTRQPRNKDLSKYAVEAADNLITELEKEDKCQEA